MSLAIPHELIVEGIALAFTRWLDGQPEIGDALLERMAELRCELMTPQEVAEMTGLSVKTLRANHQAYGFDKSTALGTNEPRYFRSQIVAAMKREGKLIQGSQARVEKVRAELREKIAPFPKRTAPTLKVAAT